MAKRAHDPALLSLQLPFFIFKHCFYWLSSIGFVCGHWLRLRKIGKLIFPVHPTRTRRTAASRHPALRWRAPAATPDLRGGIKACGAAWAVPDRIAENLIAAAEQWAGSPEQADDITVVVARMG